MKKLLLLLLTLIFLAFIIDRAGGLAMGRMLKKTEVPQLVKLNYMMEDMDQEVLFIGTSQTLRGIVPETFEDSLGMSVFNCGLIGARNIYTHYIILKNILLHHVPRLIVLEIRRNDFTKERDPYMFFRFSHLYGRDEECDSFFTEVNDNKGLMFSHLYRYNAIAKDLLTGLLKKNENPWKKGFGPLVKEEKTPLDRQPDLRKYDPSKVDSKKMDILKKFFELCGEKEIELVLVTIPDHCLVDSNYYDSVRDLAGKYNIPLFDYQGKGLFMDKTEFFYESAHLESEGAKEFSSIFSHDLKSYFNFNDEKDSVKLISRN